MIPFYEELFGRFHELHADIRKALESLPPEAMDWTPGPDMNPVSVLIVHLTGAERFWVGDVVMGDPSNRDREAEFRAAGLTKNDLLQRLTDTEAYTRATFESLKLSDLETTRTHPRHGNQVSVTFALTHALEHVATHLGHIQLTVQLWQQKH
jgi:hypothetical protein